MSQEGNGGVQLGLDRTVDLLLWIRNRRGESRIRRLGVGDVTPHVGCLANEPGLEDVGDAGVGRVSGFESGALDAPQIEQAAAGIREDPAS